jgi:hypothetical protein
LAGLFENGRQAVKEYSAITTSDKMNRRGLKVMLKAESNGSTFLKAVSLVQRPRLTP